MTGKSPIKQFALTREIVATSEAGREVAVTETSTDFEDTPRLFDLAETAMGQWPGIWKATSMSSQPIFPAEWGHAPTTHDAYWHRVEAMTDRADEAGILGTLHLRHVAVGWLPLLEHAVAGLAGLMQHPEHRLAALRIIQIKEKFGALRFYIEPTGSRRAIASASQIVDWAELNSQNRCMLTGMPGALRRGDWFLTLSDKAVRLRDADPKAFAARVYPAFS